MWTLRFLLLAVLLHFWPVEQPSEEELIAYGKEQERHKPEVLHYSTGIWSNIYLSQHPELKRTCDEANARQAEELQRYIDQHQQQPHYEQPERVTGPMYLHAIHLQRISTYEMEAIIDTEKRKVI